MLLYTIMHIYIVCIKNGIPASEIRNNPTPRTWLLIIQTIVPKKDMRRRGAFI